MFEVEPGQLINDQFSAFEDDGVAKRNGLLLTNSDFTVVVWRDAVVASLSVAITEIGSSGEYKLSYTPPSAGVWVVEVLIAFSGDILKSVAAVGAPADVSTVLARTDRILGLLHMNAILDRFQFLDANGQQTRTRLRVFDSAGNIPAIPDGNESAGLTQEYEIDAEYIGKNKLKKFTLKVVT